jgi:alpha-galactosidase
VAELVRLHKQFRPLLHGGDMVRLDSHDEATMTQGVVARDKTEALFVYARIDTARSSVPDPVQFAYLDPDRRYRAEILALPGRSGEFGVERPAWMIDGQVELTGRALMSVGLQPPVLDPESALLFHLVSI